MAELSRGDLNGIEWRMSSLEQTVCESADMLNTNILEVSNQITATQEELQKLKDDFESMLNEQRRTTSLQQASTELVTVRQAIEKRKIEKETNTMNIVEHFTRIISDGRDVNPSEKKTAVSFLQGYINKGFSHYIEENTDAFPQQITINLNDWSGQTTEGQNASELHSGYESFLANQKEVEKAPIAAKANPKRERIFAAVLAGIGIISLFLAPVVGAMLLIGAGILFFRSVSAKKKEIVSLQQLETKYRTLSGEGRTEMDRCLEQ